MALSGNWCRAPPILVPPVLHELMPASRIAFRPDIQGLATRRIAAEMIDGVLLRRRSLDEQLDAHQGFKSLSDRDRALTRRLASTVLRRLGTLRALLNRMLERGVPHDSQRRALVDSAVTRSKGLC